MKNNGIKHGALCVELKEHTDINKALRIFSKKVQDSGLLNELRDRMAYEKPTTVRKRKKKTAQKRWQKYVDEMVTTGQMKAPENA